MYPLQIPTASDIAESIVEFFISALLDSLEGFATDFLDWLGGVRDPTTNEVLVDTWFTVFEISLAILAIWIVLGLLSFPFGNDEKTSLYRFGWRIIGVFVIFAIAQPAFAFGAELSNVMFDMILSIAESGTDIEAEFGSLVDTVTGGGVSFSLLVAAIISSGLMVIAQVIVVFIMVTIDYVYWTTFVFSPLLAVFWMIDWGPLKKTNEFAQMMFDAAIGSLVYPVSISVFSVAYVVLIKAGVQGGIADAQASAMLEITALSILFPILLVGIGIKLLSQVGDDMFGLSTVAKMAGTATMAVAGGVAGGAAGAVGGSGALSGAKSGAMKAGQAMARGGMGPTNEPISTVGMGGGSSSPSSTTSRGGGTSGANSGAPTGSGQAQAQGGSQEPGVGTTTSDDATTTASEEPSRGGLMSKASDAVSSRAPSSLNRAVDNAASKSPELTPSANQERRQETIESAERYQQTAEELKQAEEGNTVDLDELTEQGVFEESEAPTPAESESQATVGEGGWITYQDEEGNEAAAKTDNLAYTASRQAEQQRRAAEKAETRAGRGEALADATKFTAEMAGQIGMMGARDAIMGHPGYTDFNVGGGSASGARESGSTSAEGRSASAESQEEDQEAAPTQTVVSGSSNPSQEEDVEKQKKKEKQKAKQQQEQASPTASTGGVVALGKQGIALPDREKEQLVGESVDYVGAVERGDTGTPYVGGMSVTDATSDGRFTDDAGQVNIGDSGENVEIQNAEVRELGDDIYEVALTEETVVEESPRDLTSRTTAEYQDDDEIQELRWGSEAAGTEEISLAGRGGNYNTLRDSEQPVFSGNSVDITGEVAADDPDDVDGIPDASVAGIQVTDATADGRYSTEAGYPSLPVEDGEVARFENVTYTTETGAGGTTREVIELTEQSRIAVEDESDDVTPTIQRGDATSAELASEEASVENGGINAAEMDYVREQEELTGMGVAATGVVDQAPGGEAVLRGTGNESGSEIRLADSTRDGETNSARVGKGILEDTEPGDEVRIEGGVIDSDGRQLRLTEHTEIDAGSGDLSDDAPPTIQKDYSESRLADDRRSVRSNAGELADTDLEDAFDAGEEVSMQATFVENEASGRGANEIAGTFETPDGEQIGSYGQLESDPTPNGDQLEDGAQYEVSNLTVDGEGRFKPNPQTEFERVGSGETQNRQDASGQRPEPTSRSNQSRTRTRDTDTTDTTDTTSEAGDTSNARRSRAGREPGQTRSEQRRDDIPDYVSGSDESEADDEEADSENNESA
jgi:hypothetical protein